MRELSAGPVAQPFDLAHRTVQAGGPFFTHFAKAGTIEADRETSRIHLHHAVRNRKHTSKDKDREFHQGLSSPL